MSDEAYGVFANVSGHKTLREGALCLVDGMNGGDERAKVTAISKGGRIISIYLDLSTLHRFRVKYVPLRFIKHSSYRNMSRDDANQYLVGVLRRLEGAKDA